MASRCRRAPFGAVRVAGEHGQEGSGRSSHPPRHCRRPERTRVEEARDRGKSQGLKKYLCSGVTARLVVGRIHVCAWHVSGWPAPDAQANPEKMPAYNAPGLIFVGEVRVQVVSRATRRYGAADASGGATPGRGAVYPRFPLVKAHTGRYTRDAPPEISLFGGISPRRGESANAAPPQIARRAH